MPQQCSTDGHALPDGTPDVPGRTGPDPLLLHLATAALSWYGPTQEAAQGLDGVEAERRLQALIAAIRRYHRHPARRKPEAHPAVWAEGSTRLLDTGGAPGAAVLVVPSLVNRHYILDISPERSFVGRLRREGLRPLLIDWGTPGPAERGFDLAVYVGRLGRAFDAAAEAAGGPVALIGYCMGGLLATALAARSAGAVSALALLATPWDFHAGAPEAARRLAELVPLWEPLLARNGTAPVALLQTLFFTVDPLGVAKKFLRFGALPPGDPDEAAFVLIEDWLNDGVPLAAPVFRECLEGWYGRNDPGRGAWRVAGERVDPAALAVPALVVAPDRDRLVPPASALALADALPGAERMRPPLGHVGMVAGRSAREQVVRPVAAWLRRHAAVATVPL